jgi:hypothetical protein
LNPHFLASDEEAWATRYDATLENCVWHVAEKTDDKSRGWGDIQIGAGDGRFLGILVSD